MRFDLGWEAEIGRAEARLFVVGFRELRQGGGTCFRISCFALAMPRRLA
jgi:hypothetical protein